MIKLGQIKALALASVEMDHDAIARFELRDFMIDNAEECSIALGCHVATLREAIRSFEVGNGRSAHHTGTFDCRGFALATIATVKGVQVSGRSTKSEAKRQAADLAADALAARCIVEYVDGAPRVDVDLTLFRPCLLSAGDTFTIASETHAMEVTFDAKRITEILTMLRTNKRCQHATAYVDAKGLHVEWRACSGGRWTRGGVNARPLAFHHVAKAKRKGGTEIRANLPIVAKEVAA